MSGARVRPYDVAMVGTPSGSLAERGRILVIEDDPMLAEVVERYLEREGFAVETRADGEAGLDRAIEWEPDLVVLDVMLPGIDGFEVCRRLRRSTPTPVVMLTARAEEDDRVLGLELGADDYVTKPFSPRVDRTHRCGAPPVRWRRGAERRRTAASGFDRGRPGGARDPTRR